MPHLIALLTLVMLFAGSSPPRANEDGAASLLLDNEDLCLRVGKVAVQGETAAQVVARALARENLAIAEELIGELPETAKGVRRLTDVLELQQRVCGDRADGGTRRGANLEPDLRMAGECLAAAIPIDELRRQALLLRFLDRREQATYAALERLREQRPARVSPVALPAGSTDEGFAVPRPGAEKARPASQQRTRRVPAAPALPYLHASMSRRFESATATVTDVDPETDSMQRWDPSPAEIAQRRRERMDAFRERFELWRPTFTREMRELAALRSALARELEIRSLQHVRSLCSQLTGTVDRVEYAVVLSAPEPSVRVSLDRMLASYAAAGRWCTSGRFAFAWIEIEKADQRWRQLSTRLAMLDGG